MRWIVLPVTLAGLALAACEAPPDTADTPAEREAREMAQSEAAYTEATFDTVRWASDQAAVDRGRDIYTWACAECHGPEGRGDGGRVIDGDTLHPPSFLAPDWPFADDPAALHEKVFIGNSLGMPHWGLRQMRPRDIVAVERYIRLELRGGAAGA